MLPVAGDIDAAAEPNIIMVLHMFDKALKRLKAARPANETAMQADIHQAGEMRPFFIEHVETVT